MLARLMALIAVCGLLLSTAVLAQDTANGTFTGVVKDSSGAVLPGVTVEAASPALIEKTRAVVTDAEGRYQIGALRPGNYSLAFSLTGFRGVRRENLELTTGFTATVNAEMSVGAVEETITVSGSAPLLDIKSSSQQTVLSGDLVRSLPLPKNTGAYSTLLPGAVLSSLTNLDVGGTKGETEGQFAIHGGRPNDGYRFREGLYDGPLSGTFGTNPFSSINPATIQEVTIQVTGGLTAEAPTGGTQTNVVMRDGGNILSGTIQGDYGNKNLQGTNVDDALKARGVGTRPSIKELHDIAAGVGGPIKKDRVWFFLDGRDWRAETFVPGNYFNLTPGTLYYAPDLGRPAYTGTRSSTVGARITLQASKKDKLTGNIRYEESFNPFFSLANGGASPEGNRSDFYPTTFAQGNWTRPVTNRLLLQAGTGYVSGWLHAGNSLGGDAISILNNQANYRYGSPVSGINRQFMTNSAMGTLTYAAGSHTLRVGSSYIKAHRNEFSASVNSSVSYTFAGMTPGNAVPQSVTYYPYPINYSVDLGIFNAFVQEQWTVKQLTLNLGLRYDQLNGSSPASDNVAGAWVPARHFDAVSDTPRWKDVNPRVGAAYDLWGNGQTVVKTSFGRFDAFQSTDLVALFNPVATTSATGSRTWRDANGNYIPEASELGPLTPTTFGQPITTTTFAENIIHGFDVRPYSWQFSLTAQHELRPGLAVNVGYFRTWYGNFQVTDNLLASPSDYSSYCVNAPSDPLLPGGGGGQICGILDISPAKFGRVQNQLSQASDYGNQSEIYNGLDFTVQARFKNGVVNGGLATARTVTNNCEITAKLPEILGANPTPSRFCEVTPPWSAATQLKLSGSYTLPYAVRFSAVFQNIPGAATTASYLTNTTRDPQIIAQLGRGLASGVNGTSTVALVAPSSLYLDGRISILDLSVGRTFRFGRMRFEPTLSLANSLNANPVESMTLTYGPAWRNVIGLLPARTVKVGARFDF